MSKPFPSVKASPAWILGAGCVAAAINLAACWEGEGFSPAGLGEEYPIEHSSDDNLPKLFRNHVCLDMPFQDKANQVIINWFIVFPTYEVPGYLIDQTRRHCEV